MITITRTAAVAATASANASARSRTVKLVAVHSRLATVLVNLAARNLVAEATANMAALLRAVSVCATQNAQWLQ